MITVVVIRPELYGLWIVDRDDVLLIKHHSPAAAISDGCELARVTHERSGAAVNVTLLTSDMTILLAHYDEAPPTLKEVAR
jgi:hypothetical protein